MFLVKLSNGSFFLFFIMSDIINEIVLFKVRFDKVSIKEFCYLFFENFFFVFVIEMCLLFFVLKIMIW